MARTHREILDKLDPLAVARYQITEKDFQLLLESDLGVVIVEADRLEEALQIITELKGDVE